MTVRAIAPTDRDHPPARTLVTPSVPGGRSALPAADAGTDRGRGRRWIRSPLERQAREICPTPASASDRRPWPGSGRGRSPRGHSADGSAPTPAAAPAPDAADGPRRSGRARPGGRGIRRAAVDDLDLDAWGTRPAAATGCRGRRRVRHRGSAPTMPGDAAAGRRPTRRTRPGPATRRPRPAGSAPAVAPPSRTPPGAGSPAASPGRPRSFRPCPSGRRAPVVVVGARRPHGRRDRGPSVRVTAAPTVRHDRAA